MKAVREASSKRPKAATQSTSLARATVAAKVMPDKQTVEPSDVSTVRFMRLGVDSSQKSIKKSKTGRTVSKAPMPLSRQSWVPPVYEIR
jgi:hypothetical protein